MGDFPSSPVVKISLSNAGGAGSFPCGEAKIPHASKAKNQNINNKSNIVTNSIKTLKMVLIKKKKSYKSHQGNLAGCTVTVLVYLDV